MIRHRTSGHTDDPIESRFDDVSAHSWLSSPNSICGGELAETS
jgi:hypothetical protein